MQYRSAFVWSKWKWREEGETLIPSEEPCHQTFRKGLVRVFRGPPRFSGVVMAVVVVAWCGLSRRRELFARPEETAISIMRTLLEISAVALCMWPAGSRRFVSPTFSRGNKPPPPLSQPRDFPRNCLTTFWKVLRADTSGSLKRDRSLVWRVSRFNLPRLIILSSIRSGKLSFLCTSPPHYLNKHKIID